MPDSNTMLVRLKPYNPRKGYVLRTYIDGPTGTSFKEERGWYEVPTDLAALLKTVHSRPESEESPLAFDVCSREEAIALERKLRRESAERASASDPLSVDGASTDNLGGRRLRAANRAQRNDGTLTTADLPGNQSLSDDLDDEPADEHDLDSDDLAADVEDTARKNRGGIKGGIADNGITPRRAGIKPGEGSIIPGAPVGGGEGDGQDSLVTPNLTTVRQSVGKDGVDPSANATANNRDSKSSKK